MGPADINQFEEIASDNLEIDLEESTYNPTTKVKTSKTTSAIPYVREEPNFILSTVDAPNAVSFGVSLDELRAGIKMLAPSLTLVSPRQDLVVEKIQLRFRELGYRNQDGSEITADGLYSVQFGTAVAELRSTLLWRGFEPGNHIDSDLIEYLLPLPTQKNLLKGYLEISEQNAALGEFPKVIKEVQNLINKAYPDAKLLANGAWSMGLEIRLAELQEQNLLENNATITAATLELLRGAELKDLIAKGLAVIQPCKADKPIKLEVIKIIQAFLNRHLEKKLIIDGIFSEKLALLLENTQKALGLVERRAFSRETYDAMRSTFANPEQRSIFLRKIEQISLAQKLFTSIGNEAKAISLSHKLELISPFSRNAEFGLLQMLKALRIDISSPSSIAIFQKRRGIPQDGRLNQLTAISLYELLSAQWCKDRVTSLGYKWRNEPNELNIIGLRGWSPTAGRNNNAENEWNDTIAFAWRDEHGRVNYKEYVATTDPGIVNPSRMSSAERSSCLAQGQYNYVCGYFNGRAGVAIPLSEPLEKFRATKNEVSFAKNLKTRLKTFLLGSAPLAIHWMDVEGNIDKIEQVGRFSLGSQVPKVSKAVFRSEISPLFYADPEKVFPYTLIDMSLLAVKKV